MLKSFPTIFTVIGCPKKSDFDHYYLIICHILENRRIISQKWSKSDFFGTPYDGQNGRKGLQHTFLHQPNTFCFMNFAVKLSAELRSVPVFSRYGKLSDKNYAT